MRRRFAVLSSLAALAGCESQPRAVEYFDAHPREIVPARKACASSAVRGRECENADVAKQPQDWDARLKAFKARFEGK